MTSAVACPSSTQSRPFANLAAAALDHRPSLHSDPEYNHSAARRPIVLYSGLRLQTPTIARKTRELSGDFGRSAKIWLCLRSAAASEPLAYTETRNHQGSSGCHGFRACCAGIDVCSARSCIAPDAMGASQPRSLHATPLGRTVGVAAHRTMTLGYHGVDLKLAWNSRTVGATEAAIGRAWAVGLLRTHGDSVARDRPMRYFRCPCIFSL